MARYNTVVPSTTTTTTATVSAPAGGLFTKITGSSTYDVTIGDPILYSGQFQTFYNANSQSINLKFTTTGPGVFVGPTASGTTTQVLTTGAVVSCYSDGTNWVLALEGGGPITGSTLTATGASQLTSSGAASAYNTSGAALLVTGGVGIGGALYTNGLISTTGNITTTGTTGTSAIASTATGSSTTTGAFTVAGDLGCNGTIRTVGLTESSSIKLKENITPISDALASVLKLKGVTYDRKDTKQHEAGLIAEHVFKVIPDVVSLDAKGKPNGIQYTKLTAYLIESIKTLQAEIDELKGVKTKGKK
jgi:hypothetical protein